MMWCIKRSATGKKITRRTSRAVGRPCALARQGRRTSGVRQHEEFRACKTDRTRIV